MEPRRSMLLATPTADAKVTTQYFQSVVGLQSRIHADNYPLDLQIFTRFSSLLEEARNISATIVLEDKRFSHLLFVDSDQGFPPQLIFDMLNFNKPVVSAIYAAKTLPLRSLFDWSRKIRSPERLLSLASTYILPGGVSCNDRGEVEIRDGFIRMKGAGTGIMLIKREVLDRMAMIPELIGRNSRDMINLGYSGRLLQCFRPIMSEDNLQMGEDVSFCQRWIDDCGGEIWSNISHEISHVGPFEFKGRMMDRIEEANAVKRAERNKGAVNP
jgi:hypothetical protein